MLIIYAVFFPSFTGCGNIHSKINSQSRLFSSQCPGISSLRYKEEKNLLISPLQISLCQSIKARQKRRSWCQLYTLHPVQMLFPIYRKRSFHTSSRIKEQTMRNSETGGYVIVAELINSSWQVFCRVPCSFHSFRRQEGSSSDMPSKENAQ